MTVSAKTRELLDDTPVSLPKATYQVITDAGVALEYQYGTFPFKPVPDPNGVTGNTIFILDLPSCQLKAATGACVVTEFKG